MKPPDFDYIVATDCDTAVAALARAGGEAKILAGGQSLMPMLNFRLLHPSILVDISRIPGLGFINETPDSVRIGALTRHFQLETSSLIAQGPGRDELRRAQFLTHDFCTLNHRS